MVHALFGILQGFGRYLRIDFRSNQDEGFSSFSFSFFLIFFNLFFANFVRDFFSGFEAGIHILSKDMFAR